MRLLLGACCITLAFSGCKSSGRLEADSESASAADGQPPTTKNNPLDVAAVVKVMNKIKDHEKGTVTRALAEKCMGNDTPHWSYIVSHFYCQIGLGRSCFTKYVLNPSNPDLGTNKIYRDAYAACSSHAQFKYIADDPEISRVFQYIMFTVNSPVGIDAFTVESQDEAINQFYGVTSPSNCAERFASSTDKRRPASQRCGRFGAGENDLPAAILGAGEVAKAFELLGRPATDLVPPWTPTLTYRDTIFGGDRRGYYIREKWLGVETFDGTSRMLWIDYGNLAPGASLPPALAAQASAELKHRLVEAGCRDETRPLSQNALTFRCGSAEVTVVYYDGLNPQTPPSWIRRGDVLQVTFRRK
jgi:hypothetical protein